MKGKVFTSFYADSLGKRFNSERWKKYYESFYKHDPNYIKKRKKWQASYYLRNKNKIKLREIKKYHKENQDSKYYSKSADIEWSLWAYDIEPLAWAGWFNPQTFLTTPT